MIIIQPDHLTAVEMTSIYVDGNGDWHTLCSALNLNTKGNGWHEGTDMGIYYTRGEAASPVPVSNPANGTPIGTDGGTCAAYDASLAGLIRAGELVHGIPHALKLEIGARLYNKSAPGDRHVSNGNGFVWPAQSSDGTVSYGNSGNINMGSLLALPPYFNVGQLQTVQGQSVARALQNYGGYFNLQGGDKQLIIQIEHSAQEEVPNSAPFNNDMNLIAQNLRVVTNSFDPATGGPPRSGYKLHGGDGTLRAPIAPPFR